MKREFTMKIKEWLKLIENNKEQIIEIGIKAYEEAMNDKNLRFIIEMNDNGEVYYWGDIAGGNSYHISVHNGSAIELFQFCFQYFDLEITEEMIINKLNEKGYIDKIEKLREEAEEECTSIECIISNHEELSNVIDECHKEAIEFEISEYAREISKHRLEDMVKNLKELEKIY